ncbi:MAG: helix-turn-helix domain-containing protein [Sphingopyxis sp.]|nr:helix-turn-helix domain-containing protein [Sphingopyxis sp.]
MAKSTSKNTGSGAAVGTAVGSNRSKRAIRRSRSGAATLIVHGGTMIAPASAEAEHGVGIHTASAGITRPVAGMLDGGNDDAGSRGAASGAATTRRRGPQVRKVSAASASKYTAATREAFLDAYLATANLKQAAAVAGVDPSTIYKWLKRYPSFAAARDRTLAEAYADLEMHMIHMARYGAVAVTSTSKNGETATGEDIGFAEVEAMIDRLQHHLDGGGTAETDDGGTDAADGATGDGSQGAGA